MRNIPQFLADKPYWKEGVTSFDEVAKVRIVNPKLHKYDTPREERTVTKVCPVCGNEYEAPYYQRNIKKTCSKACGHVLRKQRLPQSVAPDWAEQAMKLRKEGKTYAQIAGEVYVATSTVWNYLKSVGM